MARSIVVFAVVFSAVMCLMSVGGAQQTEAPPSYRLTDGPIVLPGQLPTNTPIEPPSVTLTGRPTAAPIEPPGVARSPAKPYLPGSPAYSTPASYNHDQIQSLKQRYLQFAEKRAAGMEASELQQGIAEMRRHCIISELKALAGESPDSFDGMRAEIATMALMAKDRNELETAVRSLVKELEDTKPRQPRGDVPALLEDAFRRGDRPE